MPALAAVALVAPVPILRHGCVGFQVKWVQGKDGSLQRFVVVACFWIQDFTGRVVVSLMLHELPGGAASTGVV